MAQGTARRLPHPPTCGSHTPDDGQEKDGDGPRPHGWACPHPAEQPRSGSLLSILRPAAQASECRRSCASRNTVPFGFPRKAFSFLQTASAFLKPQPVLRSSEPQSCKQEGGGALANINLQVVYYSSLGEPKFAPFPGNLPHWALLGGYF